VVAYALALVNGCLDKLGPAIELIAAKHCALQIQPEHYSIVGTNLMAAIHEVLGAAVTQEVHDAWVAAYTFLAGVLIAREKQIYEEQEKTYGWKGFRTFVVKEVVEEGDQIRSYHLEPKEGGLKGSFKPGQYLTIKFNNLPAVTAPRNYSISSAPGLPYYRISVKKVPNGVISGHIHDSLQKGSEVQIAPPSGEFFYQTSPGKNVVFLTGGVGVTPLSSIASSHKIENLYWIHSGRGNEMPLRASVPETTKFTHINTSNKGSRLTVEKILETVPHDSEFYICGPREFIVQIAGGLRKALPDNLIRYEFFGPLEKF